MAHADHTRSSDHVLHGDASVNHDLAAAEGQMATHATQFMSFGHGDPQCSPDVSEQALNCIHFSTLNNQGLSSDPEIRRMWASVLEAHTDIDHTVVALQEVKKIHGDYDHGNMENIESVTIHYVLLWGYSQTTNCHITFSKYLFQLLIGFVIIY